MAKQDPAEAVLAHTLERANLLAPREPADVAPGAERPFIFPQVIAREEELVAEEKRRAATHVSRDGDHEQIGRERNRSAARDLAFDVLRREANVVDVHHPF